MQPECVFEINGVKIEESLHSFLLKYERIRFEKIELSFEDF